MPHRDLALLDAAERAVVLVNELIDRSPRRLLHVGQMRSAVQAIRANLAEGFGRGTGEDGTGRDLLRSLEIARGETEETIAHLGTNYACGRIAAKDYWPRFNLLRVIVKMINSLIH